MTERISRLVRGRVFARSSDKERNTEEVLVIMVKNLEEISQGFQEGIDRINRGTEEGEAFNDIKHPIMAKAGALDMATFVRENDTLLGTSSRVATTELREVKIQLDKIIDEMHTWRERLK